MKVLLIDDNEVVRYAIADFLKLGGHEVLVCGSGEGGLIQFENEHPDLIITDIEMGEMNGIEVIEKIRRTDPNIAIVAMSGKPDFANEALLKGASSFLQKPFLFSELEELLLTKRKTAPLA